IRDMPVCDYLFFFFSSRRRHTRSKRDWSSDVCSSDLPSTFLVGAEPLSKEITSYKSLNFVSGFILILTIPSVQISLTNYLNHLRSEERRVGKEGRASR